MWYRLGMSSLSQWYFVHFYITKFLNQTKFYNYISVVLRFSINGKCWQIPLYCSVPVLCPIVFSMFQSCRKYFMCYFYSRIWIFIFFFSSCQRGTDLWINIDLSREQWKSSYLVIWRCLTILLVRWLKSSPLVEQRRSDKCCCEFIHVDLTVVYRHTVQKNSDDYKYICLRKKDFPMLHM